MTLFSVCVSGSRGERARGGAPAGLGDQIHGGGHALLRGPQHAHHHVPGPAARRAQGPAGRVRRAARLRALLPVEAQPVQIPVSEQRTTQPYQNHTLQTDTLRGFLSSSKFANEANSKFIDIVTST